MTPRPALFLLAVALAWASPSLGGSSEDDPPRIREIARKPRPKQEEKAGRPKEEEPARGRQPKDAKAGEAPGQPTGETSQAEGGASEDAVRPAPGAQPAQEEGSTVQSSPAREKRPQLGRRKEQKAPAASAVPEALAGEKRPLLSRRKREEAPAAPAAPEAPATTLHREERLPEIPQSAAVTLWRGEATRRPDDPVVWVELGNAYAARGRNDAAAEAYRRALKADSRCSQAWNNLGSVRLQTYEDDKAASAFRRAIKADPGNAEAHYNLGIALERMGRTDEALDSYEKALLIDPSLRLASVNPNIVNNEHLETLLLRIYLRSGGSTILKPQHAGSGGEKKK